jgi:hypothetical protein
MSDTDFKQKAFANSGSFGAFAANEEAEETSPAKG